PDLHSFPTRRSSDLQHQRARDLGEEAAGAVVLDQQHQVVAGLERAALHVARRKRRTLADRRGVAEENALLAAQYLAFMLRQRCRSEEHTSELQSLAY